MNIERIFGDPKKMKLYRRLFFIALIASVIIDLFIERHHPHFVFDYIPGIHALWGILSGAVLIVGAKIVYGYFIYRKENYYGD
jgi:hypothetical protein